MNTPWGISDSHIKIADGIDFYSTSSHGGFKLSDDRMKQIDPIVFTGSFGGERKEGWFEEDCSWAFVALQFPGQFSEDEIQTAEKIASHYYPEIFKELQKAGI